MFETLDSNILASLVLTSGLSAVLVFVGMRAKLLVARHPRKRCPACGRLVEGGRGCRCRG